MEIYKILNNNVIVTKDEQGFEQVAMGKGIGFKRSAGETLDPSLVDKIFYLKNSDLQEHFSSLINEVPYAIPSVSEKFIDEAASQLKQKLNASLHVSLVDHIYHALKRYEKGQLISNSLIFEIENLYPEEFELSEHFLQMIAEQEGVQLPVDEAGFIAMHLINAEMNEEMGTTVSIMKEVYAILNIIKYSMDVEYDERSLSYYRLLTHLKFFVQRVMKGSMLASDDAELYMLVSRKYPDAYRVANKITKYVANAFHVVLPAEEVLYLMIHLNRLKTRETELDRA